MRMALATVLVAGAGPLAAQPVSVAVVPEHPWIERRAGVQYLNFDLLITNGAGVRLRLDRIEVSVYDSAGALALRKYIAHHGISPGINTIPNLDLEAGSTLGVFNPFVAFDGDVDLARLRYTFVLQREGGGSAERADIDVRPAEYTPRTELTLPLRGRVLVYDGHDFYSHHRRIDLSHPVARRMGLEDNPVRYANDLCVVDDEGRLHRGDPDRVEEWFSFGAPVHATAAGRVVASANDVPENRIEAGRLVEAEIPGEDFRKHSLGNYVILDHGTGEFSVLAHLKRGSVTVKEGDQVTAGQLIGAIGFSGDSGLHVHLHYGLLTAPDYPAARSLPAYFTRYERLLGSRIVPVARGSIDSGDIVRSAR